jgi:hypothetical protein
VLFVALILLTMGYTMVFAALHGNWQFWTYLLPKPAAARAVATG